MVGRNRFFGPAMCLFAQASPDPSDYVIVHIGETAIIQLAQAVISKEVRLKAPKDAIIQIDFVKLNLRNSKSRLDITGNLVEAYGASVPIKEAFDIIFTVKENCLVILPSLFLIGSQFSINLRTKFLGRKLIEATCASLDVTNGFHLPYFVVELVPSFFRKRV